MWAGIAVTVIATTLWVSSEWIELWSGYDRLYKMTAATGFLITAIAADAHRSRYGSILLGGLVFSWLGDLFLSYSGDTMFLAGLVSFLIGHVAYSAAFVTYRRNAPRTLAVAALLMIPYVLITRWLWYDLPPETTQPVLLYMGVITAMLALAAGTWPAPGSVLIIVGAVLFYASDMFVARGAFIEQDHWNRTIGIPLYFGGQLFLACSAQPARDQS